MTETSASPVLSVRTSPSERLALELAAAARGETLSEFVRAATTQVARTVVATKEKCRTANAASSKNSTAA